MALASLSDKENFPNTSVVVPCLVPFTTIDTPASGLPFPSNIDPSISIAGGSATIEFVATVADGSTDFSLGFNTMVLSTMEYVTGRSLKHTLRISSIDAS